MPLIDMPLDKLKVYQGRNPRPADFDEFWDRSLAEMNSIDPEADFAPYAFASNIADCFELRFKSTKNAIIYAKFARPKNITGKIPAVLNFHGLSGSGMSWSSMMGYVSQGYCIASLDCRGQGGLSQDIGGALGTTFTTPFVRGLDGEPEGLLCRDLFLDLFPENGVAQDFRIAVGGDHARKDRIHRDGEGGIVHGRRPCRVHQRSLGGAVHGQPGGGTRSVDASHENDPPPALFPHGRSQMLKKQKIGGQRLGADKRR